MAGESKCLQARGLLSMIALSPDLACPQRASQQLWSPSDWIFLSVVWSLFFDPSEQHFSHITFPSSIPLPLDEKMPMIPNPK